MKVNPILKIIDGIRETIKETLNNKEYIERAKTKKSAFTRNRKMSFSDIINFMISAGRKNLQTELDLYFEQKGTDGVSRQAFSKARENVNP